MREKTTRMSWNEAAHVSRFLQCLLRITTKTNSSMPVFAAYALNKVTEDK